jgi:phosphoenolpyruvate carboxykinase (ATP)
MAEHQLDVYLMNTGRVGGADDVEGSEKVRIKHSSAIVKGIAEGTIEWTDDPDFGYQVATTVPGIDESEAAVLRPKDLYESLGRSDEYDKIVERLKSERVEYLQKFPALSDEIVDAVR